MMSAVLPRERWLTRGPDTAAGIALTFDDGPHPEYTPRLLDELQKFQIRATFFVVGEAVERFPRLAKRIVAEGHTLGGHTYTHSEPAETSARTLMEEVRRSLNLIEDLTQQRVSLFRPPKGKLSLAKTIGLWKLQQTIVLWNCDPRDYRADPVQGILSWVHQYQPERGDIVLMHDTHPHCIGAIEPIVQVAADLGLGDFQTIEQWLSANKRPAQPRSDELVLETTSVGAVNDAKQGYAE
ncbi:MAG: polysaccharide deacetylase [Planctomycetaceae bacterium]|nr:polysaccharide deacetylase [Planctomycetaceae bacterium]